MFRGKIMMTVVTCGAVLLLGCPGAQAAGEGMVKIGAVMALQGIMAPAFKEANAGLEDSIALANASGGVGGKEIKYVMKSCEYGATDPTEANRLFDEILKQHKPLAMFGQGTAQALSLADKIRTEYKVLFTSPSMSSKVAQASLYPSIFVAGPTYGQQIAMLLKYVRKSKRMAKVAIFYGDNAFGRDPLPFARLLCRKWKLNLVAEVGAKLGAKDVSAQVQELKAKNPDYVIFHGFAGRPPFATAVGEIRGQGMHCQLMGTIFSSSLMTLKALGPLADGFLAVRPTAYWYMADIPMIRTLRAYTERKYPEVKYRTVFYLQGFVAGKLLIESLRRADKAGELNYEGVCKALKSIKDFSTDGLTAPLTNRQNKFPVARIWKADADIGVFVPAPLPKGLDAWIRIGY